MRLLIDTNVFLEILLAQAQADVALDLLSDVDEHEFYVSNFSLHSIGLLLLRQRQPEMFRAFLRDLMIDVGAPVLTVSAIDLENVIEQAQRHHLDFDDAYQYAIAELHDLVILSFDGDFQHTPRGRKTPAEILGV
jgi:hypothetical protein